MALYLDRIQRPNGLFYHHTGTPYFWGCGDGWMAVGMAEMLRMLPKDNPYLPRIRAAYMQMMGNVAALSGPRRHVASDHRQPQLVEGDLPRRPCSPTR